MHAFLTVVVSAAIGYFAGILTPGVIRRLRGEAKQGVVLAEVDIKKLDADIKAKL